MVTEVALALVLLVGAGLLIQTFLKLREQYSGCSRKMLTLRTVLSGGKYEQPQRATFYGQVLEQVKSLPGLLLLDATTVPLEWKAARVAFIENRTVGHFRPKAFRTTMHHQVAPTI